MEKLSLSTIDKALETSSMKQKSFKSAAQKTGRKRKKDSDKIDCKVAIYFTKQQIEDLENLAQKTLGYEYETLSKFIKKVILKLLNEQKNEAEIESIKS
ncbi:hypothetical protein JJB27_09175 [Campylobacter fetus subsp. venerealis]|uniref:CopG family transcriptional regulator n=1 Tax=Campylobacter hyointestinalis subsp. hyointestinalis TaxID=91352 RepID=A0A9W5ARN0_CAMHY|nr:MULTISPECIES: ribbon-helix-helix domain-containing protein [Campylobacter]MBC3780236.1 hypothetical protein [Campylobacter fetus subsp. fetus]MBC3781949.1 hypothetical protein [Campylobacter fetus subsp. venerealis]MBK3499236.1 hypothetical protein [Campylobacter fetus subsp. venerealis]MBK3501179.1 hypothetical protein [Campylobacter fetus subsp. venerealis]MBK3503174.1 hypothetical protein [Campylobacter fetus subsp. venerealis]